MDIQIRPITEDNADALALPNEPFPIRGKLIPLYDGTRWDWRVETLPPEAWGEECFPDEHYQYADMSDDFHGLAAYAGDECVGFAILRCEWSKYLYLDNLLVPSAHRRQGVGSALLAASMELARSLGKLGVWLVVQDNNLNAVDCYFRNGFTLGGMNLRAYDGSSQAGKADLYLFKKLD